MPSFFTNIAYFIGKGDLHGVERIVDVLDQLGNRYLCFFHRRVNAPVHFFHDLARFGVIRTDDGHRRI